MLTGLLIFIVLALVIVGIYKTGIRRQSRDEVLGGVCSGLAMQFGTTPHLMRVLAVLALFCTGGTAVLIYVALWIVLPQD